jgi:hypothetical protein
MLCAFLTVARSDAPFIIVLRSPTGSWMGKSTIANISEINKYQPNIDAPNANPPPTYHQRSKSVIYPKSIHGAASYMAELSVGIEVAHRSIKVAGSDEAKGAFKTYEGKDIDYIGPDRADEHDEIEDTHEQDKVSCKNVIISRSSKGSMGVHCIVPMLDKKPGDIAAAAGSLGSAYAVKAS